MKLTKDYGQNKGVFNLDLILESGQILGFIGPNGAGKTTTLNMLTGFIQPTSGSMELFGKKLSRVSQFYQFMPRIGFMPSEISFELELKVKDILQRNSLLLNLDLGNKINQLGEFLKLDLKAKFGTLSLGNKKKVGIINALMHSPELIILDEPTSGLDPLIQQNFLELLKEAKNSGAAILLSSHVLSEVQFICDRIHMIKNGQLELEGNTEDILEKALKIFRVTNFSPEQSQKLQDQGLIKSWKQEGLQFQLYTDKRLPVTKYLVENNIEDFYVERPSLEEMFLNKYE